MKTYQYVTRNASTSGKKKNNNLGDRGGDNEEYYYGGKQYHAIKALITASQLTNNDEYIVVVIYGQLFELACIRYGKDTIWTKIKDDQFPNGFEDVAHYKGKVLKLDLDGDRGGKWIEKKSLGDIALFIGDNSSIAVLASEFNIQPNCIYFTHDEIALPTKTD
ncbi:hypothetical protein G4B88_011614 [Cannabis sativa]|uniref:KIB1-4 beta-propeller domain-containing protein n=1 Tax=Cannabis sativa TaxID=3483 RepID=A0A7J6GH86_CANSA|nr:hypothetical protein G4B88_011614 [Cannabis sativa]